MTTTTPAPRNLGDVVDQLLAVENLPTVEKDRLNDIASSIRYQPPEAEPLWWRQTHEWLLSAIQNKAPENLVDWEIKVVEIFSGKTIEELKEINTEP